MKWLDYQGISKTDFYKKTGLSNGYLDKEGGVNESSLEKFLNTYPNVRLEWLILGDGQMQPYSHGHLMVKEPHVTYGNEKSKISVVHRDSFPGAALDETITDHEERIRSLEHRLNKLKT